MSVLVVSSVPFAEFVSNIFCSNGIDVALGGESTNIVWALRENTYRVIILQQGILGDVMAEYVLHNRGSALLCTFLDEAGTPNSTEDPLYRSLLQEQIEKIILQHCYC